MRLVRVPGNRAPITVRIIWSPFWPQSDSAGVNPEKKERRGVYVNGTPSPMYTVNPKS